MQTEQLELKGHSFPCFRCMGMSATHEVTMDINNHGKLIVWLCESCVQLPETELYAHFMQTKEIAKMITKKQELKAIRNSIRHWMLDIRKPLKGGEGIIMFRDYHTWTRKQTVVTCDGEHCALCQLSHDCKECPLYVNGVGCDEAKSPYNVFYKDPTFENATKMVNALVSVYWTALEKRYD